MDDYYFPPFFGIAYNGHAFKQVGYSAFRLPIKRTKAEQ